MVQRSVETVERNHSNLFGLLNYNIYNLCRTNESHPHSKATAVPKIDIMSDLLNILRSELSIRNVIIMTLDFILGVIIWVLIIAASLALLIEGTNSHENTIFMYLWEGIDPNPDYSEPVGFGEASEQEPTWFQELAKRTSLSDFISAVSLTLAATVVIRGIYINIKLIIWNWTGWKPPQL